MKITYKQNYISIKQFEQVEIKDFSILTGLNGAGKSHFLQAIKSGQIQIDNFTQEEIVYYNYNSFTVQGSNQNTQQNNAGNKILQN